MSWRGKSVIVRKREIAHLHCTKRSVVQVSLRSQ